MDDKTLKGRCPACDGTGLFNQTLRSCHSCKGIGEMNDERAEYLENDYWPAQRGRGRFPDAAIDARIAVLQAFRRKLRGEEDEGGDSF